MFQRRLLASAMRVAAAAGLCVCLGCSGDTAPATTSAGETGSQEVLDPGIEHRLWQVAERAAEGMNGRIESAQAVRSQRASAVRLTSDALVSGNRDVWAIQIEGVHEFVCRTCSRPPGAPPAPPLSGRFITLVLDAETFDVTDWGLGSDSVDLGRLGTVVELQKWSPASRTL